MSLLGNQERDCLAFPSCLANKVTKNFGKLEENLV
jgi:hypothetical protein